MDHEQAIATKAVERYTLGEMSDKQAEEFELHFFSCQECSSELDAEQTFVEHVREVDAAGFTERVSVVAPVETPSRVVTSTSPSWSERMAAFFGFLTGRQVLSAATLGLAVVSLYQGFAVIPQLRQAAAISSKPQMLAAFHLRGAVRGSVPVLQVPPGAQYVSVSFDPVWDDRPSSYTGTLQKRDGTILSTFSLLPPAPGAPLAVLLPVGSMSQGTEYSLSVFAGSQPDTSREPLARYAFELQNR